MLKNILADKNRLFFFLTLLAAALMHWPELKLQPILSQGDIGRDLYIFEQVIRGKMLYKDIWWVYGPLMPYLYGLFFVTLGVSIASILIAKFLLIILGGLFFFKAACLVMPASWAFLSACFFLHSQQDFFFTYNHLGAITAILAVFWMTLKYVLEGQPRMLLIALIGCFITGLIKINFGITALTATVICAFLSDRLNKRPLWTQGSRLFYLGAAGLVVLWASIYLLLLKGLPLHEIRQCLPYFGDDQPHHRGITETIPYFIKQHYLTFYNHSVNLFNLLGNLSRNPAQLLAPLPILMTALVTLNFLTHPIIHLSTLFSLGASWTKNFTAHRRRFWTVQGVIWCFFILNFHEFAVSGVWYRTFWSQPFHLFFSFFMIATAMSLSPRWLRVCVAGIWTGFFMLVTAVNWASDKAACTPNKFLSMPRGQVYVGNDAAWVETVSRATAFLDQNLAPNERFLALPYDVLYYYLTGRESPTRQLIFFDHIKISPAQETTIIKELMAHNIRYILISNRVASTETGLGIFGQSYCPLIYRYLMENFSPVFKHGGNWQEQPDSSKNHGVIIFKRNF